MEVVSQVWNLRTPYVTDEAARCLLKYKYAGCDASLLYRYCWSPLAERVTTYMPLWVAPNVITLVALLLRVTSDVIISYYAWNLSGEIPAWACAWFAIAYFLYIVLDNVDGKQARKTGNSSPLGLMFDHGADSINTIMLPLGACSVMQLGRTWYLPVAMACLTAGFYFATLEEYYCGRLDLPIFNGVSDGCVLVYAIGLISALFGTSVWATPAFYGLSIAQAVMCCVFIISVPTVLSKYVFVE